LQSRVLVVNKYCTRAYDLGGGERLERSRTCRGHRGHRLGFWTLRRVVPVTHLTQRKKVRGQKPFDVEDAAYGGPPGRVQGRR